MKTNFLAFGSLLFVLSCFSAISQQHLGSNSGGNAESPRQRVLAAENKWLDGVSHLDEAAVESSESDDFTFITPVAISTKQEHLSGMRRLADAAGPSQPSTSYSVSQQEVRIYGSLALITDIATVRSSSANPVTTPGQYWQTEVWRNMGGIWKLVHVHMSPVVMRRK